MGAAIGPYNPAFKVARSLRNRLADCHGRVRVVEMRVNGLMRGLGLGGWVASDRRYYEPGVWQQLKAYRDLSARLELM